MKISILSMQRIFNYGSFLQAYGLMKLLSNRGHQVEFIDIEVGDREGKRVEVGTRIEDHKRRYDRYAIKRFIYKCKLVKRDKMFLEERKHVLGLSENLVTSRNCDMVVIGSDEVFNCNKANPYGISLQLFGQLTCAPKVISYAASCGYTSFKDVPHEYKKKIENSLNHLEIISVRDKNTYDFVKKLTGRDSNYNLDPALIYDFSKEVNEAEKKIDFKNKYMIVYAYKNRFKSLEEINVIRKYAKENNLKIYSLGDSQFWSDDYICVKPFELLACFKNAECILTDTFHGTIFSSIFHKKFGVVIRKSNENKLMDLVNRVGINDHVITNIAEINRVLSTDYSYDRFDSIINESRMNTEQYFNGIGL